MGYKYADVNIGTDIDEVTYSDIRDDYYDGSTNPFDGSLYFWDEDEFEYPSSVQQYLIFNNNSRYTIDSLTVQEFDNKQNMIATNTIAKETSDNRTKFSWYFENDDLDSVNLVVNCTAGVTKYTITYSISDSNWADKVIITPLSPIEVEKGNTTTVQVSPRNGFYFSGTDTCNMFIEDQLDYVPFTLTSDGKMYLEMDESYSNLTLSLEFTVTEGEPPVSNRRTNFYTVYAPTDENMKKINNTVFIDNNDVMSKFISYKKFWCIVPTDGIAEMKAGNYDFNFEAPVIHNSIIDVDCGTVTVDEKYHSVLDYSPFSRLTIFLPFIGFVDLDDKMAMNNRVRVNYRVDVLSGRCLAEVYVMLDETTESCIASYAGTIATDEPFMQGLNNYKGTYELMTSMQLGELTPFIIVNTLVPLDSGDVNLDGLPVEEVKKVGDCSGYIQYSFINASGCKGTDAEKTEIENLLKSGINVNTTESGVDNEDTNNEEDGF